MSTVSTPRFGGLALEPVLFQEEWMREAKSEHVRGVLGERSQSLQAFRFFHQSGENRVEGFCIEPKGDERLPVIIFNRGGSRHFGAMTEKGLWCTRIGALAQAGFLVIMTQCSGGSPASEGVDDFGGEQTIQDVLGLKALLDADSRADTERIGMYGGSRGGMMTYLCLRRVSWIRAAVTVAGSADLMNTAFRPVMEEHYEKMFGGAKEDREARSALFWVEDLPKDVPLLLLHGTADWRVNPMDSLELARRCYEERVPCRFVLYEGGDHSLIDDHLYRETLHQIIGWFRRFVRDGEPLPNLEPHGE